MSSQPLSFIRLMIEENSGKSIAKNFDNKNESAAMFNKDWDGAVDSIIPFVKKIDFSKDTISIQFDFFSCDLLPIYPTNDRVEEEIQENIKRNKEIKEQHQKDIGIVGAAISGFFMCFPETKRKCRIELRSYKIVELVEVLLSNLLSIEGVIEGSIAIRNIEIKRKNEVVGHGSSEDGVYTCSIDSISADSKWI